MAISLIKASLSDCQELYDLQIESFKAILDKYQDHEISPATETIERTISRLNIPNFDYYFICLDDAKIGAARVLHSDSLCELKQICILPEYQGSGYGQQAISLIEGLYPNALRWELATIKQEDKLCHLYEKMGYTKTGKEQNVKDGMDIIFYSKEVNGGYMNKLDEIRDEINKVDDEIARLFERRMSLAADVGNVKRELGLPIINTARERDIITRVTAEQPEELAEYSKVLFTTLFDLSRSYQNRKLFLNEQTAQAIRAAVETTPQLFPKSGIVACQGIEGANSQLACEKLFSRPNILYFNSFDAVFAAVEKGMCRYGILPIENSLHGSVTSVYDLMKKYKFHIAKSVKVKINHTLLAKPGVKLSEIKEIYSHEQALAQCSEFLKNNSSIKVTACENTAIAAQNVANSDRSDIAAISTANCAELYNLAILSTEIQNSDNNYTRFICISKQLEIYPGANRISLMFTIPHRSGSLYSVISKISALGVNLTKLESRPIPGKDFEFMFYIDIEAPIYAEETLNLICQLEAGSDSLTFLGSYTEI